MKKLKLKNKLTSHKGSRKGENGAYKGPIKVGCMVVILSGNDRKKTGKVIDFDRKNGLIKVENCALRTHFVKSNNKDETKGTEKKEGWIHVCKAKKIEEEPSE